MRTSFTTFSRLLRRPASTRIQPPSWAVLRRLLVFGLVFYQYVQKHAFCVLHCVLDNDPMGYAGEVMDRLLNLFGPRYARHVWRFVLALLFLKYILRPSNAHRRPLSRSCGRSMKSCRASRLNVLPVQFLCCVLDVQGPCVKRP